MSMRTRVLVFSTFFGSCLAIGLLLVSLTTNKWVYAFPRRGILKESRGEVNYGLFYGNKELDSGIGLRSSPVIILDFLQNEPHVMSFWLWLLTAFGTGLGLLSSTVAAIVSVLKSATSAKNHGLMVMLFASNIFAAFSQSLAFICWLIQFYQYLTHNILAVEDHQLLWSSSGLAYLGYSFYLVIASTFVVLLNVLILIYAKRSEKRQCLDVELPIEEKNQGIIMLY